MLNRSFKIKGNVDAAIASGDPHFISNGQYEQWKAPLASCAGPIYPYRPLFVFDIRDPSTAMRSADTRLDQDLQELNGQSLKRILMIRSREIEIAVEHCLDGVTSRSRDGSFHTDPYFLTVESGPGSRALRQLSLIHI